LRLVSTLVSRTTRELEEDPILCEISFLEQPEMSHGGLSA